MTRGRRLLTVTLVAGVAALAGYLARGRDAAPPSHAGHVEEGHAAAAPAALWTCGMHPQVLQETPGFCPICGMALTPVDVGSRPAGGTGRERAIRYWWDPMMNPPYISDRPGKSPMGMDLVPVYEDEVAAGAAVTVDPVVVQNMGVRVATVAAAPLRTTIRAAGYLDEAEPRRHDVNLRVSGWIERLHADTVGEHLAAGAPLFDLYSPDLQVAIEELIAARRDDAPDAFRRSAERKLRLYGLTDAQVGRLGALDRAPATVTFTSPIHGHVVEKRVVEGAAVEAGQRVLRIVDHSVLWLDAQVFEQDLALVTLGLQGRARFTGLPGRDVTGTVIFVHPHVDPMTRAGAVRLEVPNPDLTLRPGMYATVELVVERRAHALQLPREAVIDTGARQVVFVALGGGRFEPRRVTLGARGEDGAVEVQAGLAPGEIVVTSGQFLLDAESRFREAIAKHLAARLLAPSGPAPHAGAERGAPPGVTDAVVTAYLALADGLAAVGAEGPPVDAGPLVEAARALDTTAAQALRPLVQRVRDAAIALVGPPLPEQRRLFKPLSDAMIALADAAPSSGAGRLLVLRCPMTEGRWLQTSEAVANPFYGTTMLTCGEVERTIGGPER
jgi:RND family efflux transporter MFP subunit